MRAVRIWVAAVLVSVACVTIIERIFVLRWWHPACASPDGPSPYAIGFPLPYSQWTATSSIQYWVSIPAIIANVLILSVPLYFIFKYIFGLRSRYAIIFKVLAFCVIGIAGVAGVFGIELLRSFSYPAMTLANDQEKFIQYRPVFFDPPKGKACEMYD